MKRIHYSLPLAVSLVCFPFTADAKDEKEPGKTSDAAREPAAKPAERSGVAPTAPAREPGKTSDGVNERVPQSRFQGKITALNKEQKTVTLEEAGKGSHTLHIGTDTKLQKGSDAATWNDLAVGKEVEGTCRKVGEQFHAETMKLAR